MLIQSLNWNLISNLKSRSFRAFKILSSNFKFTPKQSKFYRVHAAEQRGLSVRATTNPALETVGIRDARTVNPKITQEATSDRAKSACTYHVTITSIRADELQNTKTNSPSRPTIRYQLLREKSPQRTRCNGLFI